MSNKSFVIPDKLHSLLEKHSYQPPFIISDIGGGHTFVEEIKFSTPLIVCPNEEKYAIRNTHKLPSEVFTLDNSMPVKKPSSLVLSLIRRI